VRFCSVCLPMSVIRCELIVITGMCEGDYECVECKWCD
jgi:hypothetical protein